MSLTKKIIIWFIGAALFGGLLTYTHYHLEKIGVGKTLLAFAGLVGVLITIIVNHKKKVDYRKFNIIETVPKTAAKEILPQLSAEDIKKQQREIQQKAQYVVNSLSECEISEMKEIDLYRRQSMGNTIYGYKPSNDEQYNQLKKTLLHYKAVNDSLLPKFTPLGDKICELVANKILMQKQPQNDKRNDP